MGIVADELNINFVVSTRDNFYDDGLTGINDPAFQYSFSDIYTANSLQKQWYNSFTWNVSLNICHGKLCCEAGICHAGVTYSCPVVRHPTVILQVCGNEHDMDNATCK
ncbi:hypothetical protein KIW84_023570 [Lathyrus oleraceus]|uniref:Uncharacterized protein n=1 Tax=Pisum sativum TaxID=3888 RepID=A0A9D4YDB1_PEA|nr:hypothetical protein KIW84_023570 [Pisum sativum]